MPNMSTASVQRSSPLSSPLATGKHTQLSAPRSSTASRTPSSPNALHTPRPVVSRHVTMTDGGGDASPNYFNLAVDSSKSCQSSGGGSHARANWSPPSSRVRSTAAISPRVVPLDQNPEFAEFRRQSELRNSTPGFNFAFPVPIHGPTTPNVGNGQSAPIPIPTSPNARPIPGALEGLMHEGIPRSPKRTLSSPYSSITDQPRRNSPAGFTEREAAAAPQPLQLLRQEENQVRFSLPSSIIKTHTPPSMGAKADTLPANLDAADGPPFINPAHVVTLLEASNEDILVLDLRVSTQYGLSRIRGALNLCIPTTLLKRSSYNTQKLAETFNRSPDKKKKFEQWKNCAYIIVYDASASKAKDAMTCVNMLKKFATEGWNGSSYIIRGGFQEFSSQFPALIERDSGSASAGDSATSTMDGASHTLAPVIGGCPMPATKNAANPFFGNIRQNMDLIGGVGQISLKIPSSLSNTQLEELPQWLREASDVKDSGKYVADMFLAIEKAEQRRMQDALTCHANYGRGTPGSNSTIQVAGIEKGAKNRYNSIWPYEHSRVKIKDVSEGGCDYINANHVKAAWSNKRYIATQGPIPTTFADFWNVVWQQDVRVIVMLTAETESGQIKAHNYWNQRNFGPLHLTFLSENRASLEPSKIHRHWERQPLGKRRSTNPPFGRPPPKQEEETPQSEQPYVIVRRFTLSRSDRPFERMREITQLQYSHWPDFGAPAHPAHLLGLVEQCETVVRAYARNTGSNSSSGSSPSPHSGPVVDDGRPVLVHCSAGCGRTGTFCTVDSVLDMLRRQRAQRVHTARQLTPMDVDSGNVNVSVGHGSANNSVSAASGSTFRHGSHPSLLSRTSSSSSTSSSQLTGLGEQNWIVRDDIDLIQKTVEDFRLDRLSMVQSLRQFVLCYETVLEWLTEQTPRSA